MDIICHSTSKPLIFKKYIQYLEDKYHKKVININFRDKTEGWHNSKPKVYFEDGSSIVDTVFYYAFSLGAISREECFKCTYYSIDRNSDITIGDFWGVDKFLPDMDDNKGTSVVIVSTKKGEELFEKIKNDINFKEIEKEKVLKYNHNKTAVKHKKYEKIQKKVNDDDFFEYLRKAIKLNIFERLHRRINIILKLK